MLYFQAVESVESNVERSSLVELAAVFLRLGLTAFGGPAGHLAMMEREFVAHRQWLTHQEFLDINGATNLIPGPNSTEMAIHVGFRRAGVPGMVVSGVCFILPAAAIVGLIASAYVRFGTLPQVAGTFLGVKAAMMAVIVQAIWVLARKALRTPALGVLGAIATVGGFAGINELILLFVSGTALGVGAWYRDERQNPKPILVLAAIAAVLVGIPMAFQSHSTTVQSFGLGPLFLFFLKVGSVLFGSGYVLLAFLRADLVGRWRWLTSAQLLDAIAVGQVTPGPVFTTATFIGYMLGGPTGAVLATVGIFLPSFVFVGLSGPLLPHVRKSAATAAFLDGVNVGSLALMVAVTWDLGRDAIVDFPTALIAAASLALLMRFRINSAWIVLASALTGVAFRL